METFNRDLSSQLLTRIDESFFDHLVETATTSVDLDSQDLDRVQRYARVKVDGLQSLATAMDDPEDAQELHESLVTMWIELRSEWARYNKTVNYQRLVHDEEDNLSSTLGALCSNILTAIEPLIPSELHRLADFASDVRPAISRSGRFANMDIGDRAVRSTLLLPTLSELAELHETLQSGSRAVSEDWVAAFTRCVGQLTLLAGQPGVPREVARVAAEERLLRFGDGKRLPFAPRVQIDGADRLEITPVVRFIDTLEGIFEMVSPILCTTNGPIRSHTKVCVEHDFTEIAISLMSNFISDSENRSAVLANLEERGVRYGFVAAEGLSLTCRLAHTQ